MTERVRWLLFFVVLAVLGFALFAAFARPSFDAPWSPAHSLVTDPNTWESAAELRIEGAGVAAQGADANGTTMLMQSVPAFDAATLRYLTYDVALDETDKAHLLWRSAGTLRNAPLPRAAGGDGTIDLQALPGWEGEIDAIGIAASPTDVLHPAFVAERAFTLRSLRLSSPSWRGALATLWNEWTAARPWTGRSNNTGGFELAAKGGASLTAFVAVLAVLALLVSLLLHGRTAARRLVVPVIAVGAAWLAMTQVAQLAERGTVARAAATLEATRPEFPLSAQPQLAAAAQTVSAKLSESENRPRVFVAGENQFLGEYTTWLLREHNAALVAPVESLPSSFDGPAFLVLAGRGAWEFDIASGRLTIGDKHWQGELIEDAGVLRAYRIAPAGAGS